MTQHGRQPSVAGGTDDPLRAAVASLGGDATMAPDGLTFGRMVDGGRAGKFAAEYRKVAGRVGVLEYNVPHGLGFVPAWAILVATHNASTPTTVIVANTNGWEKWTASEIRVKVFAAAGNVAETTMWFLIGGER